MVCRHITLVFASVLTWYSVLCVSVSVALPFLEGHLSSDLGPTLIQGELESLILITSAKTLVPNQVGSEVLGGHIFWGPPFNSLQWETQLHEWDSRVRTAQPHGCSDLLSEHSWAQSPTGDRVPRP